MKTISKTAIVALMTATMGVVGIAPVFAQGTTDKAPSPQVQAPPPAPGTADRGTHHFAKGPGMGGQAGVLDIERGAEGIELALVRLSYRLDLTDQQKSLLDDLKTAAIAAANDFKTATEGLRPTPPAQGETAQRPDFTERLDNRIAMEKARLAGLEAIQPSAKAFFDSLSDEQKAQLTPQRPDMGGPGVRPGMKGGHGQQRPGQGMHQGQGFHQGQHSGKGQNRPMGGPAAKPAPDAPAASDDETSAAPAVKS